MVGDTAAGQRGHVHIPGTRLTPCMFIAAIVVVLFVSSTCPQVEARRTPGDTGDETASLHNHDGSLPPRRITDRHSTDTVPRMHVLDEDARIFLFENFLTSDECDHLIELAEKHLYRSGVVSTDDGSSEVSEVRTSNGMFLERGQDPVVQKIEQRIARWTLLPVGNGEGLQILRYQETQKYDGHFDYFFDEQNGEMNGGNRLATVLMYLNDVEEGGETVFPNIPAPGGDNGPSFSPCARYNLAAKPRKGSAVLFHSIKPDGELERRSLHTACPVLKGVKWSAPKWIHVGHYARGDERPVRIQHKLNKVLGPKGCGNNHVKCEEWASMGECKKNAEFMVGDELNPGACLHACDRCDILHKAGGVKSYV